MSTLIMTDTEPRKVRDYSKSEPIRRLVGEDFYLTNQIIYGPPAIYNYTIAPAGVENISMTFDFSKSENMVLEYSGKNGTVSKSNPLQITLNVEAFQTSENVVIKQADATKEATLNMALQWICQDPDPSVKAQYLAAKSADLTAIIAKASEVFPPGVLIPLDTPRIAIAEKCKAADIPFIDPEFQPVQDSLFKIDPLAELKGEATSPVDGGQLPVICWRRPREFVEDGKPMTLFDGGIEPNDIAQGQLGDCWLMCSLASLAEFDPLVRSCFVEDDCVPEEGIYTVRLCKHGEWTTLRMDDYIPCIPEKGPIYSKANGHELWVILLEKAFAKLNGSYAAIRAGWAYEAMMDLTGAPYHDIRIDDEDTQAAIANGSLWQRLSRYDTMKYLMTLSTGGVDHATEGGDRSNMAEGLVPGHAYSLISCKNTSGGHKLCHIRNPWGQLEWNGDWSDSSPLWTPELRDEVGLHLGKVDDGMFWMSFEDMCKHFIGINICLVRHPGLNKEPWIEERRKFSYAYSKAGKGVKSVPIYSLTVTDPSSEFFITVHQQDKRAIGSPLYYDFGVTVLQETGKGKFDYLKGTGNTVERQQQLEIRLGSMPAGNYLIVPTSTGCKVEQEKELLEKVGKPISTENFTRNAVLSVHCNKKFNLTEVPFDQNIFDSALELPVIKSGDKTDLFGDGLAVMYCLKSGYNGNSFVCENTTHDEVLNLTMDFTGSENIISHTGNLKATLLIPPGLCRVMHHIMPGNDHEGWSMGWTCNAEWLTLEEGNKRLPTGAPKMIPSSTTKPPAINGGGGSTDAPPPPPPPPATDESLPLPVPAAGGVKKNTNTKKGRK